jgi:hypothetical protein
LIDDREAFGVDTNNYELFIEKRSVAIASSLNAKLSLGRAGVSAGAE